MGLIMRNRKCYTGKVRDDFNVLTNTERIVGKIDINGVEKDLYEKVYEATGTYSGSVSAIDVGLNSSCEIYEYSAFGKNSTGNEFPLPYVNKPFEEYAGCFFGANNREFYLRLSNVNLVFIRLYMKYTKN